MNPHLYTASIFILLISCSPQENEDLFDVTEVPRKKDLLKWGFVLVQGVDADVYEKQVGEVRINYEFDKEKLVGKYWQIKLDTLVPSDSIINQKIYEMGLSRYGPIGIVYKKLIDQYSISFCALNKNRNTFSCFSGNDEEGINLHIWYLYPHHKNNFYGGSD